MARFEKITAGQMRFVGEQDGPPERELKTRLVAEFSTSKFVERAYLARVAFDQNGASSVILCLRAGPDARERFAARIGEIFAKQFRTDNHLDILFLHDAQERALSRVCRPFYARQVARRWFWPFGTTRSG